MNAAQAATGWVTRDSDEWERMWSAFPGPEANPLSGEEWQYMGSVQTPAGWRHEFRHRDHPTLTPARRYNHVTASAGWQP